MVTARERAQTAGFYLSDVAKRNQQRGGGVPNFICSVLN